MPNQVKSRPSRAGHPLLQKRIALALAATFSMPVMAATVTWDGGGQNAFWSTLANWDGNKLPTETDDVFVGAGNNVMLNSTVSIKSLNVGGGLIFSNVNGKLTLQDNSYINALTQKGGYIYGPGKLVLGGAYFENSVQSGVGETFLSAAGVFDMQGMTIHGGRTLRNLGKVSINAEAQNQHIVIYTSSDDTRAPAPSSKFINEDSGVVELKTSSSHYIVVSKNGTGDDGGFDNRGLISKTGSGIADIQPFFINSGRVKIDKDNELRIFGSNFSALSAIEGNGKLSLGSGPYMNGTHTFADGFSTSLGLIKLIGAAELKADTGQVTFSNLFQSSGTTVSGAGRVVLQSASIGGSHVGFGVTVLASGGQHSITNTTDESLAKLDNTAGQVSLSNGRTLRNEGIFDVVAKSQNQTIHVASSGPTYGASALRNAATMNVFSDSGKAVKVSDNKSIGGDAVFENSGQIYKNGFGSLEISTHFDNTGLVTVDQGQLNYMARQSFDNKGIIKLSDGASLQIAAQATTFINDGRLMGSGAVLLNAANLENHGVIAPGSSAGILNITGNYVQASDGRLDIEVGGLLPGTNYDRLQINAKAVNGQTLYGNATLNGILDISLLAGYVPKVGDSFIVLASNKLFGSFSSVLLHGFGNGTQMNVTYVDTNHDSFKDSVLVSVGAIPEPETYAMMLAGLGVVGWSLRKRKLAAH